MENKLSTVGIFLDIEIAFDKTTFKSIERVLQRHDVKLTLSKWVSGMLRNREVLINVDDTEIEAVVDRGCSQRRLLSPGTRSP